MTGSWIVAIARRLLREDAFRLRVAPAIADLQFEGRARGLVSRVRDCVVIAWLVVRAFGADVWSDAASLGAPHLVREVWPRLLGLYALMVTVRMLSRIDEGIRVHTPDMQPGDFSSVPLPAAGDGLEPYLAGLLLTMAVACAGYVAVPAVFMLRRRHVTVRAIVISILALAALSYSAMRLARPVTQQSSDYAAAAIMRATGWYPAGEPLSSIIRDEIRPQREAPESKGLATLANGGRDPAAGRLAHTRWVEVSSGLGVMVYALVGAAIARGSGIGVLLRLAGIAGTSVALASLLPYVTLLIWPVYPPALTPFDRPRLESQLAFALLPLAAGLFLLIPRRERRRAA